MNNLVFADTSVNSSTHQSFVKTDSSTLTFLYPTEGTANGKVPTHGKRVSYSLDKLKQTLLHQFSPWQGMNITGSTEIENSFFKMTERDVDHRPSLGLFYYDELNKWTDWNIKY